MTEHEFKVVYDSGKKEWRLEETGDPSIYLSKFDKWIVPNTNTEDEYLQRVIKVDETATALLKKTVEFLNMMGDYKGEING